MTATRVCPQCGKPLSSDAPQGLCPACLLKAALPGQSALESSATGLYESPTTALAPEAGARLKYFGDYELLEEIARGGMGVVWKARQTSLNRDVALKMIRAGALASPEEVQRFLREAEAAANLQHPNIVAIHEVGEQDGQHYFTMDYVAGRDLGALVKDGPLPPNRAAFYVKIIAEAIHFAHQRGTLHRDLKPQNVLIDAADQPRITDFGLAKIMKEDSPLTQSGVVMGSPSYMPPEQAASRYSDIGPASDVYSLGAMLYELLTGRPPFRAATALATLREVMEDEPDAPRRLKADIPPDLETICLKCLEKLPFARYPTARALAEELDRYLKGEPILARPAGAIRKAVSWAGRHPGALAAAAAFGMVALAFGVFYLFEENAFLRAQKANPALVRVTGLRTTLWMVWCLINVINMLAGPFLVFVVAAKARRLILKEFVAGDLAKVLSRPMPIQPLSQPTRIFAIGAGLVMIGCGIMLLVTAIQAYIWEVKVTNAAESLQGLAVLLLSALFATCSIQCAFMFLGLVIRDYRLVHYGIIPDSKDCFGRWQQLTPAQVDSMYRALKDGNWPAAIERFREAAPNASEADTNQYVLRLYLSLPAKYPEMFLQPRSLATLNWIAVLKCALSEMVILVVVWSATEIFSLLPFGLPPSHPLSAVSKFAYSFLFGMALCACPRVNGLWKRLLLVAPALAVMILSEIIVPRLVEATSYSPWPYVLGVSCGFLLMVAAFYPRRQRI
jgi:tRNA A-37 threonylcarbamoyl transferase component Bud32